MRRKSGSSSPVEDLFSASSSPLIPHQLAGMSIGQTRPASRSTMRRVSRRHGVARPPGYGPALLVTGFASIAQIVEIVAARASNQGTTRVLLGTEPFATSRVSFGSPAAAFTQQVHDYWTEQRGVSLRLSAKIVQAIQPWNPGLWTCASCRGAPDFTPRSTPPGKRYRWGRAISRTTAFGTSSKPTHGSRARSIWTDTTRRCGSRRTTGRLARTGTGRSSNS